MAKGKYKIPRAKLRAIDKKIKEKKEIIPDWLKQLKKEKDQNDNATHSNNY